MGASLKDKTVLVTGGTRGIGKETAGGLARLGATVAILGRDESRGIAAAADIRAATANERVAFLRADLSSQAEVRRLAQEVAARHGCVHVLVNNAAVVRPERRVTVDGIEETLAVGHLGCGAPHGASPADVAARRTGEGRQPDLGRCTPRPSRPR